MTDKKIYETKEDAKKAALECVANRIEDSALPSAIGHDSKKNRYCVGGNYFTYRPPQPDIKPGTVCKFWDGDERAPFYGEYCSFSNGRHRMRFGAKFKHAIPFDSTNGLFAEAVELLDKARVDDVRHHFSIRDFLERVEKWKATKNDN